MWVEHYSAFNYYQATHGENRCDDTSERYYIYSAEPLEVGEGSPERRCDIAAVISAHLRPKMDTEIVFQSVELLDNQHLRLETGLDNTEPAAALCVKNNRSVR